MSVRARSATLLTALALAIGGVVHPTLPLAGAPAAGPGAAWSQRSWATIRGAGSEVFELRYEAASRSVVAVTGRGALWYDREGRRLREIVFSPSTPLFPAAALIDRQNRIAGYCGIPKEGRKVVFLDAAGREIASAPCARYSRLAVTAASAERESEALVELGRGRGLDVFERVGRFVRRLSAPGYLTAFRPAPPPSEDRLTVLYSYPVAGRQGRFTVLSAGGEEISSWLAPATGDFELVRLPSGSPAILLGIGDEIRIHALGGERLKTLPAPGIGEFRTLLARATAGGEVLAILASGSGYLQAHLLTIFDAQGAALFRERGPGHAYSLLLFDETPVGLLVGLRGEIREYRAPR